MQHIGIRTPFRLYPMAGAIWNELGKSTLVRINDKNWLFSDPINQFEIERQIYSDCIRLTRNIISTTSLQLGSWVNLGETLIFNTRFSFLILIHSLWQVRKVKRDKFTVCTILLQSTAVTQRLLGVFINTSTHLGGCSIHPMLHLSPTGSEQRAVTVSGSLFCKVWIDPASGPAE